MSFFCNKKYQPLRKQNHNCDTLTAFWASLTMHCTPPNSLCSRYLYAILRTFYCWRATQFMILESLSIKHNKINLFYVFELFTRLLCVYRTHPKKQHNSQYYALYVFWQGSHILLRHPWILYKNYPKSLKILDKSKLNKSNRI